MPDIENRWTVGNILVLFGIAVQMLVLGGGGLWYARSIESRVEANESAVISIQGRQREMAQQLRTSEANYGRMDERLIAMQAILIKVDRRLEKISP